MSVSGRLWLHLCILYVFSDKMASFDDQSDTNSGQLFPLPIYYDNVDQPSDIGPGKAKGRGRDRGRPPPSNRGRSRGGGVQNTNERPDNTRNNRRSISNHGQSRDSGQLSTKRNRGNTSQHGHGRGGRRDCSSIDRQSRCSTNEEHSETRSLHSNNDRSSNLNTGSVVDRRQGSDSDCSSENYLSKVQKKGDKRPPPRFTEHKLITLSKSADPDAVLLDIGNSRSGFLEFIRKTPDPKLVHYLVRLLCTVADSTMLTNRRTILQEVEKSFLNNLTEILNNVSMREPNTNALWNSQNNLVKFLIHVTKLLNVIITTLPTSLGKCKSVITAIKGIKDEHEVVGIDDALAEVDEVFKREKQAKQRPNESNGGRKSTLVSPGRPHNAEEVGSPSDNFRDISIFPTSGDLQMDDRPFLRANKTEGKYDDLETYLDIQFRLLREDYIQPLRKGVTEYRKCINEGLPVTKLRGIKLYHSVQVMRPICSGRGINHILQFDTTFFKKLNWTASRRLLYGSLVCLSRDNFQTFYYATVTERDAKDLNEGNIQVHFENRSDILEILPNDVFVMTETAAYFEAFRYILAGLQEMGDTMPLQRYIINCKTTVKPPKYLLCSRMPQFDFTCLLNDTSVDPHYPILNTQQWPSASELRLDISQYEAIQQAITKELAIIQGPPGTGKTHVGLRITQLLLNNSTYWNSNHCPILIVCYTNHALDQFLEGIAKFGHENIVRIGGRCKNEELQPFVLRNIKQKQKENKQRSFRVMQSEWDCKVQLRSSQEKIENVSKKLKKTSTSVISYAHLNQFMTEPQKVAFEFDSTSTDGILKRWLGMFDKFDDKEKVTKGEMFKRVWKLTILETVKCLPDHERDSIQDVWDLDLCRRAEMYKSWLSEVTDNIQYQQDNWSESNALKDVAMDRNNLQDLASKSKETVFDIGTLLKYVSKSKSCMQIQTLIAGKAMSTAAVMMKWLQLTGSNSDVQSIRIALDIISNTDIDTNHREKEDKEDDDEDMEEERQLDDDDILFDYEVPKRDKMSKINNDEEWLSNFDQRKIAYRVKNLLNSSKKLSTEHSEKIEHVWGLEQTKRNDLYAYWIQMFRQQLKEEVKDHEAEYNNATDKLEEVRDLETVQILKEADIMGMTTTGAAKYRKLLQTVCPKIIIVEEAAEVLESHIVTTLNENCQHLILIGDHKQLRPSTTVYELSTKYKMNISLFERMVRNNVPCVTLQEQHRMRPEISSLLRHKNLYPNLRDHGNVLTYENIKGVDENVQFVDHDEPEATQQESTSYSNPHEAKFIAALCRYFLNQGYDPQQITVITPYMGQVLLLKREMPKTAFEGVRITAVDNFQGEENDIILLSLVRSNSSERRHHGRNMIGFVGIENRICVSLSRAKKGLYVFGNFKLMQENSPMWSDMIYDMRQKGQVKTSITLRCRNHPQQCVYAEKAKDFENVPNGGCMLSCDGRLQCGHRCPKSCHLIDSDHMKATCQMPCNKIVCDQGHRCKQKCWQNCGKCNTFIEKTVPMCGHKMLVPCHMDPYKWRCKAECEFQLPCGHACSKSCCECTTSQKHEQVCKKEVTKSLICKHEVKMLCHENVKQYVCQTPCNEVLNCSHNCKGKCGTCFNGRIHEGCKKTCGKRLPCGHECTFPCSDVCPPCNKACEWKCSHGLLCKRKCWEECEQCRDKCAYKCKHRRCEEECHEECTKGPCEERCMRELDCGHFCKGLCSEKCVCILCQEQYLRNNLGQIYDDSCNFIQLPNCGCILESHRLDINMKRESSSRHEVLCKQCPHCLKPIRTDLKRYTNILKQTRLKISNKFRTSIGSDDARKRKILTIEKEFQRLKQLGLTDSEIKQLCNHLNKPNNFGALHTAEQKLEKLRAFLSIYNIIKDAESTGVRFTQEVEGLINPQCLQAILLQEKRYTTKQFWGEVDVEIERLRLGLKLCVCRFQMNMVPSHKNNRKLHDMFGLAFMVLSNRIFDEERTTTLKYVCEAVKGFKADEEIDQVVSNLAIRLTHLK